MNRQEGCIVFDAVGTLIRPEESISECYRRFGLQHGVDLARSLVKERFQLARNQHFSAATDQRSSESVERQKWSRIVAEVFVELEDTTSLFDDLWDYYSQPESWIVFPDVGESLHQLQQHGWSIFIGSNFDSRLLAICNSLDSLAPVDRVFCSSQIGFCKPDPRFYIAIGDLISGLLPDSGVPWMVGDDPIRDVQAARRAGWSALHLDRSVSSFDALVFRHFAAGPEASG